MELSRLMDAMRDYGADVPGVMERFMDDVELYAECLDDFLSDPSFEALGQALAAGDAQAAFVAAHTLKGVAANLGLTPLLGPIGALVEPLRKGCYEGLSERYAALILEQKRLKELVDAL